MTRFIALLILAAVLFLPGCESKPSKAVTFTTSNFENIIKTSKVPVLVDCWAEWCVPCREMNPVIRELAAKYEGKAIVGQVNVDDYPLIADKLGVQGIPALFIFKDGVIKKKFVGITSKDTLSNLLTALQ
jgi:thioredoxin 1